MWSRIFGGQLALTLLALSAVVLPAGLLIGHWDVLATAGGSALVAVGALAVPLKFWLLEPGRALADAVRGLRAGDIERLAAHRAPPWLRELLDCVHDIATAQQSNAFFLADVAHQLRTEIQLLQIRLEGLDGHVDEAGRRLHSRALADTERLHSTLTEHLELAKLIEVRPPLEIEMCEVVVERAGAWSDVADRHGITIRTLLHGRAVILARSGMLEQLLDILLDNAVRHSPRASTIIVSVQVGGRDTTLRVVDEGPGMTAEERERATVRGWRGEREKGEGRGLGLSIAGMLVGANGGRLTLAEAPGGRGVDARCTFPVINPGAAAVVDDEDDEDDSVPVR
ncbi:HAMP domain-containing sensor histidine kinase [Spirillospora sp. NPDC000708]|uniref:sensor histidine kinase n=1 Tax=Actinomadura TaxID=1988 RepID=UPI0016895733|nr:HAMP domain-containing sensor histidine kinase [Actinomadura sp. RB99]MBD2892416.1 Adaptive-response sensory-kinase SasA [Actinomadura sp. RB99]